MRYFKNKLPDFVLGTRTQPIIDDCREKWKEIIKSYANLLIEQMPPTFDNCDGGLYVGCAGIAYMFYYLANSEIFLEYRDEFLTRARNYTDVSMSYATSKRSRDPQAAFLLGGAGVIAISSLVNHDIGQKNVSAELNKKYEALAAVCQPVDYLGCGSDELFVGRAGYLCGTLLLHRKFGKIVPERSIYEIIKATIHSGRLYSKRKGSKSPLMYAYYDTEYLGAAHGLSSILQMLLCFPELLKSDLSFEADVHQSVDFMLELMQSNGNIPPAMDEAGSSRRPQDEELVHWCHGAPGIVYLFAKAFLFWKDEKYLKACLRCGELTWQKGLLKKGPGICHGIAGSGYVFLLLYRITSDEKHLHRALKFAEFMLTEEFRLGARRPDSPFSLYEGLAGTVCFLADLLQARKAEFPLFDVFSYGKLY